ncbi:hypothetical protein [Litoreibacter roseus]|uniref:hypothetical protein n=1 Tax=Litoreibacter roseus TaxID=2601869 RepID=UPI00135B9040|nr:hypothetical protein [Litoreibacter roseus]
MIAIVIGGVLGSVVAVLSVLLFGLGFSDATLVYVAIGGTAVVTTLLIPRQRPQPKSLEVQISEWSQELGYIEQDVPDDQTDEIERSKVA